MSKAKALFVTLYSLDRSRDMLIGHWSLVIGHGIFSRAPFSPLFYKLIYNLDVSNWGGVEPVLGTSTTSLGPR